MQEQVQSEFDSFELSVTPTIQSLLKETSKWANFLAILGFVGIGLLVVIGIFVSIMMGSMPDMMGQANPYSELGIGGGMIGVFYIVMGLLYFFPVLYMYKFARKMKIALDNNDNGQLTESFKNLKALFKFMGIMAIIILSIYVLVFLLAILGAAFF